MPSSTTWVINFANSIVGVGVLAIPFCFHRCGIIMAILLILTSNFFTKKTCGFLLRSAQYTRTNGFESLALHITGPIGKLLTEICTIGLLIGTLVAFQVVIGDLSPPLVSHAIGVQETWSLRASLMCLSCFVIVPLSLMRNISSLAGMSAMSVGFYVIFIISVALMSLRNLLSFEWVSQVNFWKPDGFFHCLPIISLAFSCQTQVFVMYEALPDPTVNAMNEIIRKSINLVSGMYISVGLFGYITFYAAGIRGDILANFPSGFLAELMKAGFWVSVVISFPLIIFPLRVALHSLLFSRERKEENEIISSAADYIPQERFIAITLALITGTLIVGITVPHIETVLSVTGACIGTFLCFVFPSFLYLRASSETDKRRRLAKIILAISLISMVISTFTVLTATGSHGESNSHVNVDKKKTGNLGKNTLIDKVPAKLLDAVKPPVNLDDKGLKKITDKPPGVLAGNAGVNLRILNAKESKNKEQIKDDGVDNEKAKDISNVLEKAKDTESNKEKLNVRALENIEEKKLEKTSPEQTRTHPDGNEVKEDVIKQSKNEAKDNKSGVGKKRVRKNESSEEGTDVKAENHIKSRDTKNVPELDKTEKNSSKAPGLGSKLPKPLEKPNRDSNSTRSEEAKVFINNSVEVPARKNSDLSLLQSEHDTEKNLAKTLMITSKKSDQTVHKLDKRREPATGVKGNLIRKMLETRVRNKV